MQLIRAQTVIPMVMTMNDSYDSCDSFCYFCHIWYVWECPVAHTFADFFPFYYYVHRYATSRWAALTWFDASMKWNENHTSEAAIWATFLANVERDLSAFLYIGPTLIILLSVLNAFVHRSHRRSGQTATEYSYFLAVSYIIMIIYTLFFSLWTLRWVFTLHRFLYPLCRWLTFYWGIIQRFASCVEHRMFLFSSAYTKIRPFATTCSSRANPRNRDQLRHESSFACFRLRHYHCILHLFTTHNSNHICFRTRIKW